MQETKNILGFLLFISFLFSCNNGSERRNITEKGLGANTGKVIAIVDGDTYDILFPDKSQLRIRMEGIDAPERGMPYYKVSQNYLGQLCFRKNIKLEVANKDRYGRTVAKSFLEDGREIGEEMIKAGMAWHFKKYSSDSKLSSLEIEARNKKVGLWADKSPTPPWEKRKNKKPAELEVLTDDVP